jgi:hypothetical protein
MTFIAIYQSKKFISYCKALAGENYNDLRNDVATYIYSMPCEKLNQLEQQPKFQQYCNVIAYRINYNLIGKKKSIDVVYTEIDEKPEEIDQADRLEEIERLLERDKTDPKKFIYAIAFERISEIGLKKYSEATGINYNTLTKLYYHYRNHLRKCLKSES